MQKVSFLGGELVLMRDSEQDKDAIGIAQKMAALAAGVGRVSKDRTISMKTGGSYGVVSYEAFAAQVRAALRDAGLAFFVGTTESGMTDGLTLSSGFMSFMDTATGALLSLPWKGQGGDNSDKGANKALTAGVKYALMRSLLVSTDDDTDESSETGSDHNAPPSQGAREQAVRDNAPPAGRASVAERMDPPPAQRSAPRNQGNAVRDPETVRTAIKMRIDNQIKAAKWTTAGADAKLVGAVSSRLAEVFAGDPDDSINIEAHQVVKFLFNKTSIKDLTDAEGRAVLGWTAEKVGDDWILPEGARLEARKIVASLDAVGQESMPF